MNNLVERLTALSRLHNSDEVMKMFAVAADQIAHLENHIGYLEDTLSMMRDRESDQVWYWQGDGEDYPESLVCPVVISAQDLRDLLPTPTITSNPNGPGTTRDDYDRAMDTGSLDDYDRAMELV